MPIPISRDTRLEQIDTSVIEALLLNDADEDIYHDFKEGIDSDAASDKYQMRKTLVSFANTFGGFVFFGILDRANRHGKRLLDRVVGLRDTDELGRRITQKYLERGLCIPLLTFEGPRIVSLKTADVAVIKVPRSERRPHAIKKDIDTPLEFWARGSGTARPMDCDHLLIEVDQSREMRGWLNALYIDLEGVLITARENMQLVNRWDVLASNFNSIVHSESGNLLRILSNDVPLVRKLFDLKREIALAMDVYNILISKSAVAQAPHQPSQQIMSCNNDIAARSRLIEMKAVELLRYLTDNYQTVRELRAPPGN
jgi:hypothetical protein